MPLPSGEIRDLRQYIGNYLQQPAWNPTSNGAVCAVPEGLQIIEVDPNLAIKKSLIPGRFEYPDWSV